MRRVHDVKESVNGSSEDQKKKATCTHEWVKTKARIFSYMIVRARCRLCRTWREKRK